MSKNEKTIDTSYLELSLINEAGKPSLTPLLIKQLLSIVSKPISASAVIITGSHEAFCTGLDIESLVNKELNKIDIKQTLLYLSELLKKIEQLPLPVIACVEGVVQGGGVGFVSVADLVIATPQAKFSLPETTFGLIPAVVFPFVVRRIGLAKARLLALGAPPFLAQVAQQIGLIDEISDDLSVLLKKFLKRFQCVDQQAIGAMKKLAFEHFTISTDYYEQAINKFNQLLNSETSQTRIRRFYHGETPWQKDKTCQVN